MPNKHCEWSGKIQYASVAAAMKARRGIRYKRKGGSGGRLHAYRCQSCAHIHLGHGV